ncbi:MAG: glycosyltransferase family protein [Deltaproteobacteria bacterium]|nr:glycosyltransferase family protein [Deltaproteobacteria bacterium]
MKTGIVIQARTGSTRLPGKVLLPVGGRSVLELCAVRAARSKRAGLLVIATTDKASDDPIAREAERLGVPCVRGSEEDVLARYRLAALAHDLDVICRVTSDCPLIDPDVLDGVFDVFSGGSYDYVSNALRRTFPRGLDAEVFSRSALERTFAEAKAPEEREHVTPYLYRNPGLFSLGSYEAPVDLSHCRWTVDEAADLEFVRQVAARFGDRLVRAGYREIAALLDREPEVARINAHVAQKEVGRR